jgi:hypothetical protein
VIKSQKLYNLTVLENLKNKQKLRTANQIDIVFREFSTIFAIFSDFQIYAVSIDEENRTQTKSLIRSAASDW